MLVAAALLLLAPVQQAFAQDDPLAGNSYSPYSLFGFGDVLRQGTTYNLSMGGIGIADRNVRYINLLNPAAVTAREQKSFMMDFGLENRNTVYRSGASRSANNTFNMHHIVASLPIARHSAFKLGVMPYSSVAYDFKTVEYSDRILSQIGDIEYEKVGKGGVYQAFLGAGVTLWNHLSLGADFQYYFGRIDRRTTASFSGDPSFRDITSGWDYNISCFGGKVGVQYTQPLSNALSAVLGVTYDFSTKLRGNETRYAMAETPSTTDTISFDKHSISNYSIPSELGVGLSFRYADRWMVGFDYTRQNWKGMDFGGYPGVDFSTGVAQNFRAGFEITPNRYDIRYFLRRLTYRAGAYHEISYLTLGGSQVASTGVTLGVGIPVFRYYNSINLGVEFGQRGTLTNDLIRERYFLFTISFNLHDIWFIKPLYN
ncbi:MAG: hypothetical protein IJ636_07850 [Bacteroidales bacterium]|nr:hypothetical protein [Bacteroidales bacterium]